MENVNKQFLLSIIIPTRNRETYAYSAAMQTLKSTNNDVQVVLQDNSDTKALIDKFKGSVYLERIKYNYSSGILSFVDNFSKGIEIADGEYLCMIGDDDGINPEITQVVSWAKNNNVEAISPEIKLNYIWPGTGIPYYKNDNGNLMIINFNKDAKFYETKTEIDKLVKSGGQNYLKYNLAKIYHGIVKKSAMDKVKLITGKYFGGLSPDIYSSVALSLVIARVLKINYPLTIPGVCRKSGSGHSSTGRHHGKLEDAPQLVGHEHYEWSNLVPKFYSVETLWADSALASLVEMKRDDLVKKFNVSSLSAYCFNNKYKDFYGFTKENYMKYCKIQNFNKFQEKFGLALSYINGPYLDLLNKIIRRFIRKKNDIEKYEDVEDIFKAEKLFQNYLTKKKMSVNEVIMKLNELKI